jgi:hypothetical protein
MGKTTGKRGPTTPKGHKTRAEAVLARKAVQHHEFVGDAEPERAKARVEEEQRIERDHEQLDKEIVHEMERELKAEASATPKSVAEVLRFPRPRTLREGVQLLREKAPEIAELIREKAPGIAQELRRRADSLRAVAETRLARMPAPVRETVHLSERAVSLMVIPVRLGVQVVARALRTPAEMLRLFVQGRRST